MLMRYLRHIILAVVIVYAAVVYGVLRHLILEPDLFYIRLVEVYALSALALLYLSLLPGPLYRVFPLLPFRPQFIKARRALGVGAFLLGLLHGTLAFFLLLGGFPGLRFLSNQYLVSISVSFTALLILAAMAATSFDVMMSKLGRHWKQLHRFVYLAGTLILIHAMLLGSQFVTLSALIPEITFTAVAFLLILEAICLDRWIAEAKQWRLPFGYSLIAVVILLTAGFFYVYFPSQSGGASFNIHAAHIQLAQQAQQGAIIGGINPALSSKIPGLNGDRTKRYTVGLIAPPQVTANQDVLLQFRVYDASSGNPVSLYFPVYTKLMHLIIVNQELTYFSHIHPTQLGNTFSITTRLPADDLYHLYIDFQPLGAVEQQFAFTLPVGAGSSLTQAAVPVDTSLTKTFGNYSVTMKPKANLVASQLSIGLVPIDFTMTNNTTHQPVTTLKPYLGAFGHLTMINEQTYDYIHVHPNTLTQPQPDQNGGPTIEFLPLGLYGPIKPGVYRVFAQFNPDNQLFTADFTVRVQ